MKRLESSLRKRLAHGKLLVAYVTAGYPDEASFLRLLPELEQAGVDAVEIGLPFSDPLADGPVIQQASQRVIEQGMTTQRALELAAELGKRMTIPLLAMGYMNPLLSFGLAHFLQEAQSAGISGLILPDLPLHADRRSEELIAASPLSRIQLATPASTQERLRELAAVGEGFIYMVSRLGVTGGRLASSPGFAGMVQTLRSCTKLPLLTGFGISDASSAAAAAADSDGVIVGSALLRQLGNEQDGIPAALQLMKEIRSGLDRSPVGSNAGLQESPR